MATQDDKQDGEKRKVGELLVRETAISATQLKRAQKARKDPAGGRLGMYLTKQGVIDEGELSSFLSKQYGVPSINLNEFEIEEEVIRLIPREVADKHQVVPVNRAGGSLIVATPCPEGIPREHAKFAEYIGTPSAELLQRIREGGVEDRVTAAPSCCLARFRERIDIGVVSHGLTRETVETMRFGYFESLQEAVEATIGKHGVDVQIAVIPAAGEVYAYVEGDA